MRWLWDGVEAHRLLATYAVLLALIATIVIGALLFLPVPAPTPVSTGAI